MANFSPILPGTNIRFSMPDAIATSSCFTIESLYALEDIDLAMPVVPSIEIPSTIPSFGFIVLLAIFLPSGTEIVTTAVLPSGIRSFRFSAIILRGPGLMA